MKTLLRKSPSRPRGNVILTALFVSIFLFFLSVALIYSNRQDIALSLSMEHKLKAQSAARSGAYEAFARLRQVGDLQGYQFKTFDSGATAEVSLVQLPASAQRGEKTLLRCKGTSGPLSSYFTLHLREVHLAGKENRDEGRVLLFPQADGGASTSAIFGDFLLKNGGPGVVQDMVANAGPIFVSRDMAPEVAPSPDNPGTGYPPPAFVDYVPVFTPDGMNLTGWGKHFVIAPPFPNIPKSVTEIQYLKYENDEFDWVDVEPPTTLGTDEPEPGEVSPPVFVMEGPPNDVWTVSSIRGIEDALRNLTWVAEELPTRRQSDIEGGIFSSLPYQIFGTTDWSLARGIETQEKFVTRGAVAARGRTVISHGWHYVFQHYQGSAPGGPIEATHGSTLTRWPCLLRYTIDKDWEKVWAPLDQSGSVNSSLRPDPNVLVVSEGGKIFSTTVGTGESPRRLLTLEGDRFKLGNEVPPGYLFAYQDQPYVLTEEKLQHLTADKLSIDFESLPRGLPEIRGEIVDLQGTGTIIIGMEGGYKGEALDSSRRAEIVARPRYEFEYSLLPGGPVAVDGDDLWAIIQISVDAFPPESQFIGYDELPFPETESSPHKVLARYDGERWHIFPHGLRAALKGNLSAPGAGVISAVYDGLPKQVNRYTVIGIDTDPFRTGL